MLRILLGNCPIIIYFDSKTAIYCGFWGAKMKNIGKQIAERRKKKGLTQQDLAEISGVSPRTINSVEVGKANPSINVLNKIVKPIGFVVSLTERVKHE